MNIIELIEELKILKVFFENPTDEFNVREVSRIVKISPATASKKLKLFAKREILKDRKERGFNLYKANLEKENYRDLKIYYNINKLRNSGLIEALNIFYLKPTIILFGSASSGFDTKESDFDLLVITEKTKDFLDKENYEKKIGRKLQIFVVQKINDLKNENLINSILNGITIQGDAKWK